MNSLINSKCIATECLAGTGAVYLYNDPSKRNPRMFYLMDCYARVTKDSHFGTKLFELTRVELIRDDEENQITYKFSFEKDAKLIGEFKYLDENKMTFDYDAMNNALNNYFKSN